jgi:hypothetical protein
MTSSVLARESVAELLVRPGPPGSWSILIHPLPSLWNLVQLKDEAPETDP